MQSRKHPAGQKQQTAAQRERAARKREKRRIKREAARAELERCRNRSSNSNSKSGPEPRAMLAARATGGEVRPKSSPGTILNRPGKASVGNSPNKAITDYCAFLANPAGSLVGVRPPTGVYGKGTDIAHSSNQIEVRANFRGENGDGRFAGLLQLKPGTLENPGTYQLALVDTSTHWPGDLNPANNQPWSSWTAQASYLDVQLNGADIRTDKNWDSLFSQTGAMYQLNWDAGAAAPITVLGTVGSAQSTLFNGPRGFPNPGAVFTTQGTTGQLRLPAGNWLVNMIFLPGGAMANEAVGNPFGDASMSLVNNAFVADTYSIVSYIVAIPPDSTPSGINFPKPAGWTPTVADSMWVNVASAMWDGSASDALGTHPTTNAGFVAELRPAAGGFVFTCVENQMNDGGEIACAWIPSRTCTTNWFTDQPTADVGQLQYWDALSVLTPFSRSGKLRDGASAVWVPEQSSDFQFRSPDELSEYHGPCLAFAGRAAPPQGWDGSTPVTVVVGKLRTDVWFEFTTPRTFLETKQPYGASFMMDEVMAAVQNMPRVNGNPDHLVKLKEWFKWVLSTGGEVIGWMKRNPEKVSLALEVGGAAGALLLA